MESGKWKMGIKLIRNSSMESPPIFILKWKNIAKTILFIYIFLKRWPSRTRFEFGSRLCTGKVWSLILLRPRYIHPLDGYFK